MGTMIKRLFFGRGEITERMLLNGRRWGFEFKKEDLWVGLFWKTTGNCADIWICFVPCFPLHISFWYHDPEQ